MKRCKNLHQINMKKKFSALKQDSNGSNDMKEIDIKHFSLFFHFFVESCYFLVAGYC